MKPFKPYLIDEIPPITRICQTIRVHISYARCALKFHVDDDFNFSPKQRTGLG
jgi:hypothetical protein